MHCLNSLTYSLALSEAVITDQSGRCGPVSDTTHCYWCKPEMMMIMIMTRRKLWQPQKMGQLSKSKKRAVVKPEKL